MSLVVGASLLCWVSQWAGIYFTLIAFGLEEVGWGGAGLLLVTITLAQAFPVLPGNLLVFQAAAVVPLTASYGVGAAEAIAFSVVLQATEAVVGVAVGLPLPHRRGGRVQAAPAPGRGGERARRAAGARDR